MRSSSRSATPGTSPRTGGASSRPRGAGWRGSARGCTGTRQPAPRPSSAGRPCRSRRRSRRRYGSGIRRRGRGPSPLATSRAARSTRSPTPRSATPTHSPRAARGSFASPRPLLAEYEVRPARSWAVSVDGDGDGIPTGDENLFVVAARAAARAAQESLGAYHVTQRSTIPIARGLGSSAAAIVGGVVAANTLMGEPLDRRSLLRIPSEVEGHADNVAAALYGAFTVALPSDR